MKQTIGLTEVPGVIRDFMESMREKAREKRLSWYTVTSSFVSKTEVGIGGAGSSHNMDEKKQEMKKRKRVKKQFKNADQIDAA